jgi:hypothetical protein
VLSKILPDRARYRDPAQLSRFIISRDAAVMNGACAIAAYRSRSFQQPDVLNCLVEAVVAHQRRNGAAEDNSYSSYTF